MDYIFTIFVSFGLIMTISAYAVQGANEKLYRLLQIITIVIIVITVIILVNLIARDFGL